jgi:hypothetical protein
MSACRNCFDLVSIAVINLSFLTPRFVLIAVSTFDRYWGKLGNIDGTDPRTNFGYLHFLPGNNISFSRKCIRQTDEELVGCQSFRGIAFIHFYLYHT